MQKEIKKGHMMMEYFDCHMHELNQEKGGFLIALDGRRGSKGGYSNREIQSAASKKANTIPVQYVDYRFCRTETPVVKYHPRREKYAPAAVVNDIKERSPQIIIIDTLNQPDWVPNDYWHIAKEFPNILFLFSHAGGFDMLQFFNIAMYQPNVWIDFSFVQHVFGMCGQNTPLKYLCELMEYALTEERLYKKLMLGTDNMRGGADLSKEILEVYEQYSSYEDVASKNYLGFINRLSLRR